MTAQALPPGPWKQHDAATTPVTNTAWDRRARAAGHVTVIRRFESEDGRSITVQVRPMTSEADACTVLDGIAKTFDDSVERSTGRRAISLTTVPPPSDAADLPAVAYDVLVRRGFRAFVLGVVRDCDVVSVVAYGRRGAWDWNDLGIACAAQLQMLHNAHRPS